MNQSLEHLRFPNESTSYRQARNALLQEEMELRRHIERVAQQRRALPKGGEIPEDYVFEGKRPSGRTGRLKLSELFAPGKETLAIYSFMFGPERAEPCPGCTHFLDGLDGAALHIGQRINLVVVAIFLAGFGRHVQKLRRPEVADRPVLFAPEHVQDGHVPFFAGLELLLIAHGL